MPSPDILFNNQFILMALSICTLVGERLFKTTAIISLIKNKYFLKL